MAMLFLVISSLGAWIITEGIPPTSAVNVLEGTFCVTRTSNHRFSRFWIPALSFESLLCVMALNIALRTMKSTGSFLRRSRSLMSILIRDSVFYFFMSAPLGMVEAPIGFSIAMSSVFASRMLVNLREAADPQVPYLRPQEIMSDFAIGVAHTHETH
ncbi:hypothetical protein JR316_0010239 [Psilocybe cubensis]|uniref:Uncharacterized protein n=1 Tax=Psilocybe cubensis TaxID=181762 RepID=A0ACB8GR15_PSICU|nr:hypothetical protein JR316_0010239 [Psilocybe cubensis]KAH9478006.1 hypothetical protein JR316_0010239 [Psilocybe cubensis]